SHGYSNNQIRMIKHRPSWLIGISQVGEAWITTPDPSAVTFPRVNADNTVSYLSAANMRTALDVYETGVLYTQTQINSFFTDPTNIGSFNAGNWATALGVGTVSGGADGEILWVQSGLIEPSGKMFDMPLGVPTLNAAGAIEATVQVRKDTQANIDAIVLK